MHPGHEQHQSKYEEASHAYTVGNFDEAFAGFTNLVDLACPSAATYLAEMNLRGEGTQINTELAIQLLRLAIDWGYATAAFNLAAIYHSGHYGVARDVEAGRHWFIIAKKLGCTINVERYIDCKTV